MQVLVKQKNETKIDFLWPTLTQSKINIFKKIWGNFLYLI